MLRSRLILPLTLAGLTAVCGERLAGSQNTEPSVPIGGTATTGASSETGDLNLEDAEVPLDAVQPVVSDRRDCSRLWALATIVLLLVLVGAATYLGRRAGPGAAPRLDLTHAQVAAKTAITLILLLYGATRILAVITVYLDTRVVYESTEEYFRFLKPARLAALSHAHLMGIGTMDGITALLFAFSRRSSGFATGVVTAAFLGVVGDIGSWWLIKYVGAGFELLSFFTGTLLCSLSFLIMTLCILWDAWVKR